MRAPPLLPLAALLCLAFACGDGGIRRSPRENPIPDLTCGDGLVTEGEDCDGSDLAGQSCTSLGFDLGTLSCDASCRFATTGCVKFCGNGTIDPGEQCDGEVGPLGCDGWGYRSCSARCQVESNTCRTTAFTQGPTLQMASGGPSVIADLVPTGYADLISAVPGFGRLQTHAWKPAQGFTPDRTVSRTDAAVPVSPIAGDLDGDGRMDLAAVNADGTADRYRFEPPAAGAPARFVVEPLGSAAGGGPVCEVGPWLGVGRILGGPGDDLAALACAGATGSITWDGAYVFPSGPGPLAAVRVEQTGIRHGTLGDVDGDGKPDLVLSLMNGDVVVRRAPDFAAEDGAPFAPLLGARALQVADLDGDGDGDLLALVGGELAVLENLGHGVAERRRLPAAGSLMFLARDLDGDGRPDVAWLERDRLEVRRNVGGFTFTSFALPLGGATGTAEALSFVAGDVDGDGDLDLAATWRVSPGSDATVTHVLLNGVK